MKTYGEWVFPGHPDKLSDRIADSIVDEALIDDPDALVGIEVAVHRNKVFIDGRIACPHAETFDCSEIARRVFRESGYSSVFLPDPTRLSIDTDLCVGDFREDERRIRSISDDQNIVTGYAELNPDTNFLPIAHFVAYTIAREFCDQRKENIRIGPDGKVLVVIESEGRSSGVRTEYRLEAVSFSVHHQSELNTIEIVKTAKQVLECAMVKLPSVHTRWNGGSGKTEVIVNGAGDFAVGGPEGDNGLAGKKLVVDAYGPHIPIGGGALSGKDPHKIDRAMALRARQIAKHIVISGVAERALVWLAFVPGEREPRWKNITLFKEGADGSARMWPMDAVLSRRWLAGYDLTIEGTFRDLRLDAVWWSEFAAWGHFTNPNASWERWFPGRTSV
ncbi:MAG: methionine adenosyltransferase domain-containing protein [bacterium]|nr:methionine adenosyltransferase domain-containing protein [bacterium]